MKKLKALLCMSLLSVAMVAQDKDFHVYLCLGQSNMEGNAKLRHKILVALTSGLR